MEARQRYSASAKLREIVGCFLDFQEMEEDPNLMRYPVTDRRVFGQDAQSSSQKADKMEVEFDV